MTEDAYQLCVCCRLPSLTQVLSNGFHCTLGVVLGKGAATNTDSSFRAYTSVTDTLTKSQHKGDFVREDFFAHTNHTT